MRRLLTCNYHTIHSLHCDMDLDITISDYRTFLAASPATLELRPGSTALLGVNNAGKSSLLKLFHEFRPIWTRLAQFDRNLARTLSGQASESIPTEAEFFPHGSNGPVSIGLRILPHNDIDDLPPLELPITLDINVAQDHAWNGHIRVGDEPWGGSDIDFRGNELYLGATVNRSQDMSSLRAAAETLAGMRYIPAFRNAVTATGSGSSFDIAVGQAAITKWDNLDRNPSGAIRQSARAIEQALRDVFGYEHLEITVATSGDVLLVDADGRTLTLQDLGAGFTHFFVTLVSVASQKPTYLLIDEPEIGLHPTLQLRFLSTLDSFTQYGTIFATHSVGLARSYAQRIYSVQRESPTMSKLVLYDDVPDLPEFLGELSFSGYKELGFESVLLVEGVTEVKTFHQFLRRYGKDRSVVVMHMGGSDLINGKRSHELEELTRITPDVFAVIDSERDSTDAVLEAARADFQRVCDQLGIRCHVLERRAIENYFPQDAIQAALGPHHMALGPYDKLPRRKEGGWQKDDNWRIADKMTKNQLQSSDLGEFLDAVPG